MFKFRIQVRGDKYDIACKRRSTDPPVTTTQLSTQMERWCWSWPTVKSRASRGGCRWRRRRTGRRQPPQGPRARRRAASARRHARRAAPRTASATTRPSSLRRRPGNARRDGRIPTRAAPLQSPTSVPAPLTTWKLGTFSLYRTLLFPLSLLVSSLH